jgi:hypothetical protein
MHVIHTLYQTCKHNRLPEDEFSGSKHVDDIRKLKIKILLLKRYILLVYIVKVKFTLEQATKTQKGSRRITLLFL